jgi:hypothetical protein
MPGNRNPKHFDETINSQMDNASLEDRAGPGGFKRKNRAPSKKQF